MTIGQRIKLLRKSKKMTLKEFGAAVEATDASISTIENGKYQPSLAVVINICNTFKVSADYLLFGEIIEMSLQENSYNIDNNNNTIGSNFGNLNNINLVDLLKAKDQTIEKLEQLNHEKTEQIKLYREIIDLIKKE